MLQYFTIFSVFSYFSKQSSGKHPILDRFRVAKSDPDFDPRSEFPRSGPKWVQNGVPK